MRVGMSFYFKKLTPKILDTYNFICVHNAVKLIFENFSGKLTTEHREHGGGWKMKSGLARRGRQGQITEMLQVPGAQRRFKECGASRPHRLFPFGGRCAVSALTGRRLRRRSRSFRRNNPTLGFHSLGFAFIRGSQSFSRVGGDRRDAPSFRRAAPFQGEWCVSPTSFQTCGRDAHPP